MIAESFERIHRSNLVGMGVLPVEFRAGDSVENLGLTGREVFDVVGLTECLAEESRAAVEITVRVRREEGDLMEFPARLRLDTPQEVLYYRHGGILHYVLRQLLSEAA